MAGLEDELGQQLQEVQLERATLEDEWRTIREREACVRRREEQVRLAALKVEWSLVGVGGQREVRELVRKSCQEEEDGVGWGQEQLT